MKKGKLPKIITILILTLVTVVMWISLGIYRAISKKPAPNVPEEISKPLTPTLDMDSLDKIQSRIFLSDTEIPEIVLTQSATPAPEPEVILETENPEPGPLPTETPVEPEITPEPVPEEAP